MHKLRIYRSINLCAIAFALGTNLAFAQVDSYARNGGEPFQDVDGVGPLGTIIGLIAIPIIFIIFQVARQFLGNAEAQLISRSRRKKVQNYIAKTTESIEPSLISNYIIDAVKTDNTKSYLAIAEYFGKKTKRFDYFANKKYPGGSTFEKKKRMSKEDLFEFDGLMGVRWVYEHWAAVAAMKATMDPIYNRNLDELKREYGQIYSYPGSSYLLFAFQQMRKDFDDLDDQTNWETIDPLGIPDVNLDYWKKKLENISSSQGDRHHDGMKSAIIQYLEKGE